MSSIRSISCAVLQSSYSPAALQLWEPLSVGAHGRLKVHQLLPDHAHVGALDQLRDLEFSVQGVGLGGRGGWVVVGH